MKHRLHSSALLVGTLAAIATLPAHAQAALSTVEEIIVTARRVEEPLQDVPISISVLTEQQIADRNIVSAGELGTYVPSLSTNSRFGSESSSFAIRGFTQEGQTAPSVAVYFADVTAPRAQGGTTGGNGAGVGSFFDLQNVQVLRGPQGTLFGRNTTGGAVLLVPQKPTSEFEGYAEVSAGNYDMRRLQAVLNTPFSDTVRFRIGADTQKREGYLKNQSGIGPDDFNDVDYWAVRASLVVDIGANIENYTIASFSDSDTHGSLTNIRYCNPTPSQNQAITAPLACTQIARQEARGDGYYDVENGNPFASQRIKQRQLINTTTWRATDELTVKNIASYAEFTQDQTSNIFGDNFALGPGIPFGYVAIFTDRDKHNISQWTATEELQLQGRSFNNALVWQTGLYFEKSGPLDGWQGTRTPILLSCTNAVELQCMDPIGMGLGFPIGFVNESPTKYWFRGLGAYAQGTYSFNEQFSTTVGVRYTSDKTEGVSRVRTFRFLAPNTPVPGCSLTPNTPPLDGSTAEECENEKATQKSKKPTWTIDFEYKPVDAAMLYAKYSRGYRQGGVNANNLIFVTWKPEKVDLYELGAKTTFDGAISGTFNVTLFHNDFTNQQLAANAVPVIGSTASPAQGIVNAGKSRIRGVEVDSSLALFQGFRLDASYAYLDTKLKSFADVAVDPTLYQAVNPAAEVGGDLALSPKHRFTATGTYMLPLPESVGRVSVGATYVHTAKQVAQADSPIGTMPATDILNLNLNWRGVAGSPIDASLFATNVTKEKYPVFISGSATSAGFDGFAVGLPRMYGVRLRYNF